MSPHIDTWLKKRKITIQLLRKLANELDNMQGKVNISKLAGTGAAVVGGMGILNCFLEVTPTGGLSMFGLIAYGCVGLVGSALNLGTLIVKSFNEKDLIEKVQTALDDDRKESETLNKTLTELSLEEVSDHNLDISDTGKRAVKLATDAKGLRSVSQLAVRGLLRMVAVVTVALLPLDIYDLIQTVMKVHKGSINESAKMVREIARELKQEMENIKSKL